MSVVNISEGISNRYLIPGISLLVLGFLLFFLYTVGPILLIIIAIGLLSARTGLLVNTSTPAYKYYSNIFGITFGEWVSLESITDIVLVLNTEQSNADSLIPGIGTGRGSFGGRTAPDVRTYDLKISDGILPELILVNDFLTYRNARKAFDVLCATCQVEGRDLIAEQIAENQERRSRG